MKAALLAAEAAHSTPRIGHARNQSPEKELDDYAFPASILWEAL
jgi:hypothetical protein